MSMLVPFAIGAVAGALFGALIGAFFVQVATRIAAGFMPRFGRAFGVTLMSAMASFLVGFLTGELVAMTGATGRIQQLAGAAAISLLLQWSIIAYFIEYPDGRRIGYWKAFLILLMLFLIFCLFAGILFLIRSRFDL